MTGEQRWHAIGAAEAAVLLVVHVSRTENENGVTNIFSLELKDREKKKGAEIL